MALVLNDRVKETTTTTGTGTFTLAGAVTGFETFGTGIGNSNTTYYAVTLPGSAEFEVGLGTLSSDSSTLARTTVISSSNSDSAVNFSAGTKTIFCTLPAAKAVFKDASDNINGTFVGNITGNVTGNTSGTAATVTGAAQTNITSLGTLTGLTIDGDTTFTGTSGNIVFDKSDDALEFADNVKAVFGTGGDLEISHNGSHSIIKDNGVGALELRGSSVKIRNVAGTKDGIIANQGGAVELYHNNVKKVETTSDGATVTGDVTLTSTDDGASDGPILNLFRNSASPAVNDQIGEVRFLGKNDAGQDVEYGSISSSLIDATDGSEDSRTEIRGMVDGADTTYYQAKFGLNSFNQNVKLAPNIDIIYEGATDNANETTLTVVDPTADRTITFPDSTGTVALTSDIPSSGISSGNVATFTSGVADNDFLRIDGTSVEGRSASEVRSDISAITLTEASDEATALAIALG